MTTSVFADIHNVLYKHRFDGELFLPVIAGGTPSDPKVAEGWLRTKLGVSDEQLLREKVAEAMVERGITADEALTEVNANKHLNGFKRDEKGLYIEGRQLKAAIKEAASVALAAGNLPARGWGKTNKALLGFIAEHIFVLENRLYLGVEEASGVIQKFVHTFRGSGIQYEEVVNDATISFTVVSDYDFSREDWGAIWTAGEQQGLGASRSQGFGRYQVTRWDRQKAPYKLVD